MSHKPTISYLSWSLNNQISGGQNIILGQAKELLRRGFQVNLVTHNHQPPNAQYQGFKPVVISPFNQDLPSSDIIIATFWPTAYELANLTNVKKYYLIQHFEPLFTPDRINQEIIKNSYRLGHHHLVVSTWLKDKLHTEVNTTSTLVPNAINPTFHHSKFPTKKSHAKLKLLAVISQLADWKGISELLGIYKQLKTQRSDIETILVTADPQLKKSDPKLPIDTLIFDPTPKKLSQIYQQADLFLHTSYHEGFGLPPLEAMASGTCIVAIDSGGVNQYAKHNHNAYIVPNQDYSSLLQATLDLLDNPKLRNKLAKAAWQTAKKYTWENTGNALEEILNS